MLGEAHDDRFNPPYARTLQHMMCLWDGFFYDRQRLSLDHLVDILAIRAVCGVVVVWTIFL